jgi:pimeloyl-ACP methyl ester carboxylesterase
MEAGFDAAARTRHLAVDLHFMRVELEHVGDRRVIERLAREVVAPARAAGCRSIWLAGISLGGFFALDYAANQAGCDGLCLLAPYLGNRQLIAEIAAAPGLEAWDAGPLAESDEERRIWRFIRDRHGKHGPERRPVYLGYGREDRFARGHALMAEALPPGMVHVAAGGHDWPTWSALWEQFLTLKLL